MAILRPRRFQPARLGHVPIGLELHGVSGYDIAIQIEAVLASYGRKGLPRGVFFCDGGGPPVCRLAHAQVVCKLADTKEMPTPLTAYKVFIATPGGLDMEREAFCRVIHRYNESDALPQGVQFIPIGWEITLGGVGRPQSLINEELRECDYFVLVLCDRWGSPPDVPGSSQYSSGIEEEYAIAQECLADQCRAMRQLVTFFKAVSERQLSDPGEQLKKVLAFRKQLEENKSQLYHTFDEPELFEHKLRCHLAQWLRDNLRDRLKRAAPPTLPPGSDRSVRIDQFESADESAKDDKAGPEIEEANRLADAGRLTEAETLFATTVVDGRNVRGFAHYGRFLIRLGRLSQAQLMFDRVLALAAPDDARWAVGAYNCIGVIEQTRGDFERARQLYEQALELAKKSQWPVGTANAYVNLGVLYQTSGNWQEAERAYRDALEIGERHALRPIVNGAVNNLAILARLRGELREAEQLQLRSLRLSEQEGQPEAIASNYSNLGMIYRQRGQLPEAENMFRSSLQIEERLGHREGVATDLSNLGLIAQERGDLEAAEEYLSKALAINEELQRPEGLAKAYGNLGIVYKRKPDLMRAKELFRRALELQLKLSDSEGVATSYGNLAGIAAARREFRAAEELLAKSLEIHEQLGHKAGVANDCANRGLLHRQKGDWPQARAWLQRGRDLYAEIGSPHKVEQIQGWLAEVPTADQP